MPLRVAVLASGRGSNLDSLLRHIRAGLVDAAVTLVLSDRPEAGALEVASMAGVPAVVALPPEAGEKRASYDARLLAMLQAEAPDLVVLAGYLRIVGPAITAAFQGRIVNIHPALLPSFRGLRGAEQAYEAGVRIAGCTTHVVTDALDGGPILLQAALVVRAADSKEDLQRRILRLEHLLLPRTVQLFAQGRIVIEAGRARVLPGDSWLHLKGLEHVSGALHGEGF